MNNDQKRTLSLEKTLLRYNVALENGDFETIAFILKEAESDTQLERLIFEVNDLYAAEIEEVALEQDALLIRELIETELLSALPGVEPDPPPLTVGHVIARIHADAALRGRVEREALAATRALQGAETPLPAELSLGGVSKLLQELGIEVGRRFQTLFRETALFMRMGRNQGMARMAATRRQQEARLMPSFNLLESRASYTTEAVRGQASSSDSADNSASDTSTDTNNKEENL